MSAISTDYGAHPTQNVKVVVAPMVRATGGDMWLVSATDGDRDWADSYEDEDEAEQVATDIKRGVFDPWEETR